MPRPVHFEMQADDPQRAINFYQTLFGWEFTEYMPGFYWLIKTGEPGTPGIDGGMNKRPAPTPPKESGTNAFVLTVDVPNVDEIITAVEKAGCEIAMPKHAIPTVGWLVYFVDTEGNTVGAMQADPNAA